MRFIPRRAPMQACAIVLCTLTAAACGDSPVEPEAPLLARSGSRFTVASVRLTPPTSLSAAAPTLALGDTARFTAQALDARKRNVPQAVITWQASNATVSQDGLVKATSTGSVTVTATSSDQSASFTFEVKGSASPDSAPPAATPVPPGGQTTATSIAASIVRFDGGSGQTVVSTGVPLVPGALRPGQEGLVRVIVGGAEQAVYVAPLAGRHADGSFRAVLVQLRATVATGTALPARVELGTARAATFTLSAPVAAVAGVPGTALLPTEPTYLIATDIVGATLPASATTAMGGAFARYDVDFAKYADQHWAAYGDAWEHNYYDRAQIYYAQWARTGNPTYWYRGTRHAYAYRAKYLEPNNMATSPHWAQLEGLEKHYLVTGDETSRLAVARASNTMWATVASNGGIGPSNDPRITGRVLLGTLLAWRLGGAPGVQADWSARLEEGITKVAAWQASNGSFPSGPLFCDGQYNFMVGMLNDALTQVHASYKQDARIVATVKRAIDYMWGTQWIASAQAFQYGSVANCPDGGTVAAGDLTGMIVAPFSWVAKQTGDASYRTRGDEVFAAGVAQAALSGTKHFNQAYTSSWRYFGFR